MQRGAYFGVYCNVGESMNRLLNSTSLPRDCTVIVLPTKYMKKLLLHLHPKPLAFDFQSSETLCQKVSAAPHYV